jgi:hypothetical protein
VEPTIRTILPGGWSYTQTLGASAAAAVPFGATVVFPADSPTLWTYPTPGCAGPAPVTWGLLDLTLPAEPDDGAAGVPARR